MGSQSKSSPGRSPRTLRRGSARRLGFEQCEPRRLLAANELVPFSYAWIHETSAGPIAEPGYSYNASGDDIDVQRSDTGYYYVRFHGLNAAGNFAGGHVQVSAHGANTHCNVDNWRPDATGDGFAIIVRCHAPDGTRINSSFTAAVMHPTAITANPTTETYNEGQLYFAWAGLPVSPSYVAVSAYSHNPYGDVLISRTVTGRYEVTFEGVNPNFVADKGGHVQVSTYGSSANRCQVGGWNGVGEDLAISVTCTNVTGTPEDTPFTIAVVAPEIGIKSSIGYAWASQPTLNAYTPLDFYASNPHEGNFTARRHDLGRYSMTMTGGPTGRFQGGHVQVTAYGSPGNYCNVDRWVVAGNGDMTAFVDCFDPNGNRADARYTLIILPPVDGDRFEPNDTPAIATDLGSESLVLDDLSILECGGASEFCSVPDYYLWTAPGNGTLIVTAQFDHTAVGDLDLELLEPGGVSLQRSLSTTDNETVSQNVVAGQSYIINVRGKSGLGQTNVYSLAIGFNENAPQPDSDEPNDSFDAATELPTGEVVVEDGNLHDGQDVDYFRWVAHEAGVAEVVLGSQTASDSVVLSVFDAQWNHLVDSPSHSKAVLWDVVAGDTYYLSVRASNGVAIRSYDLTWAVFQPLFPEDLGLELLDTPEEIAPGVIRFAMGPSPEDVKFYSRDNVNAADTINADVISTGGASGLNLDGSGVTVGIWDGARVHAGHQEFDTRVTIGDYTSPGVGNHATHVAGTIGARGLLTGAQGMAPNVNLVTYDWTNDLEELAANAGRLDISNHSYGTLAGWSGRMCLSAGTPIRSCGSASILDDVWMGNRNRGAETEWFGKYDAISARLDAVLADNPHLLSVWSAGNERTHRQTTEDETYIAYIEGTGWVQGNVAAISGFDPPPSAVASDGGYDTLPGGAKQAKNSLVVGAVNDVTVDPSTAADVTQTSFSSWGPVDDGRVKPDVVANGAALTSSSVNGGCSGTSPATLNNVYTLCSGTSMAAPSVSGTAALLVQRYEQLLETRPRSATTKGLLIHTAKDVGNVGPDYANGWGLVDATAAEQFLTAAIGDPSQGELFYEGTYSRPETFTVEADGDRPLKATIVWTDPAGPPAADGVDVRTPTLVNDLNLIITGPDGIHLAWTLDPENPSNSARRNRLNHVDNVEQVVIDAPVSGTYTVTVNHSRHLFFQDYSFFLSGATLNGTPDVWVEDTPVRARGGGPYTGLPDEGREPEPNLVNPITLENQPASGGLWQSQGIWVRQAVGDRDPGSDGIFDHRDHQAPLIGTTNEVFVEVRNRGNAPALNTRVEVYWANAGTGLFWDSSFELIGSTNLSYLPRDASMIVGIPWDVQPDATGHNHYCLVARLVHVDDPISHAETSNVRENTLFNNNIAWKNVNPVGYTIGHGGTMSTENTAEFHVGNDSAAPTTVDLHFAGDELVGPNAAYIVDLGDLFDGWLSNGGSGTNVEIHDNNKLQIKGLPADIFDIPIGAAHHTPVLLTSHTPEPLQLDGEIVPRYVSVTQVSEGAIVGGVVIEFATRGVDADTDGDQVPDSHDDDDDGDGVPDNQDPNPLDRDVTAVGPEIRVTVDGLLLVHNGSVYDFGDVPADSTVTKTFVIENTGSDPLVIDGESFALPAGYELTRPVVPSTIPSGGGALFDITFRPTNDGEYAGVVSFDNNDADEGPFSFDVTANALDSGAILGDINRDLFLDASDIDTLFELMDRGQYRTHADLDGSEGLSSSDVAVLVEQVFGTHFGDIDLDGDVDATDFGIWSAHRFTLGGGWRAGDMNGDGAVDGSDANLWLKHRFLGRQTTGQLPRPARTPRSPLASDSENEDGFRRPRATDSQARGISRTAILATLSRRRGTDL